jgi:hypothetical protein
MGHFAFPATLNPDIVEYQRSKEYRFRWIKEVIDAATRVRLEIVPELICSDVDRNSRLRRGSTDQFSVTGVAVNDIYLFFRHVFGQLIDPVRLAHLVA